MDSQDIISAFEKFKNKKLCWVDFAEILRAAKKEKIPITLDINKVREFLKAYHFISELGLVANANIRATGYTIVVRLPYLKAVIKPEYFKLIMQDLLEGKLTDARLTKIVNDAYGINPGKYAAISKKLKILIKLLDDQRENIDDMRNYLAEDCDNLNQRLQCIYDKTYYELWKEREEFRI